jgi:hypothetical protein
MGYSSSNDDVDKSKEALYSGNDDSVEFRGQTFMSENV